MLDALLTALVLGVAAYRLWRLVGYDKITERWRTRLNPFWYDMVTCPWCAGSWIAFAVTAGYAVLYGLAYPILVALAAAVVTGILGDRG